MEYFDEVLDRKTGELTKVSMGDWITLTELGSLYGVGKREVRTVLRKLGVVEVEGAATHQRHRLAAWVVQRGWGKRIERRNKKPFDVVGPDLRVWIEERWVQAVEDIASEATAPSLQARAALADFNARRSTALTTQQSIHWLADWFPHLTQTEMGMVLEVTQQLVGKYLNIRSKQLREAEELKAMDLDERQAIRGGAGRLPDAASQGRNLLGLSGLITHDYNHRET